MRGARRGLQGDCAVLYDHRIIDTDRRARHGRGEVEVRLVLPSDLAVVADRDVHIARHDHVLQESRLRVRIDADVDVPESIPVALRLLPVRADQVLVLRGAPFTEPTVVEREGDAFDPAPEVRDGTVEHDGAPAALLVRHDVHLARRDVRHVVAAVEVLLRDHSVFDPRLPADEVAREPRPVRRGDLDSARLRQGCRELPAPPHDLAWVYRTRLEHHRPPCGEVEPVRAGPRLRDVAQPDPRAAEAGFLRAAVPFVVVRGRRIVLVPAELADFRDVRRTRDEDVRVRLPHRLPFVRAHVTEL